MSKRHSNVQSNTLLNYFQSPKAKTPKIQEKTTKEEPPNLQNSEDDDVIEGVKKRRRIKVLNSDSGSENESPNKTPKKRTKKFKKIQSDSESEEEQSNNTKKDMKDTIKSFTFKQQEKSENGASSDVKFDVGLKKTKVLVDLHSNWLHNRLEFLKPEKIKDTSMRSLKDPQYNPRTLYVPEAFMKQLTPAMYQWWQLKSDHFDCVLFFKVGKFYELYHMDAVVGVKELGFSYMKGEFAHSGFPEGAYAKMKGMLLDKGYKVARVEQTETPDMMAERCSNKKTKTTKFDKVVKREICQISSKGTLLHTAQMPESGNVFSCYLYALTEKQLPNNKVRFGVCFIETTIGSVFLSEFDDDKYCSKLMTIFSEYTPGMFLLERGAKSPHLNSIIKIHFKDVRKETLTSKTEFYTATQTLEKFHSECYFRDESENFQWPEMFTNIADNFTPKDEFELAIRALGACAWYLKYSEIDRHIFSLRKFAIHSPLNLTKNLTQREFMVLDSKTISKLDLIGGMGTLQKSLDNCKTAFGKRLLLEWICRPSCNIDVITERQNAVKELYHSSQLLKTTQELLRKLPDLQRQIAKIHNYGNRLCVKDHPDGRAILYEEKRYSKRKIFDLVNTLNAFELVQEIPPLFAQCESRLLKKITQYQPTGMNIDLKEDLLYFQNAFDFDEAKKQGQILPRKGEEADYDNAEENINIIQQKLNTYLKEQEKFFACKLSYFGNDRKRFQLTVPDEYTRKVTDDYLLESSKKGYKRYTTPTTKKLLAEMMKAENERSKIILDLNRRVFAKFSKRNEHWEQVTHCLTILDVLCSLASYAVLYAEEVCMPKMKPFSDNVEISLENARHPCITNISNFVPNDIKMGSNGFANIYIITGPNMGGKSTLMRQIAVICVMAQIGSFVPASSCSITIVDRVFTRLGAEDEITQGKSTFMVELSEAGTILEHATPYSLVLLDELGRGTSTHDGNAIATAYVRKLTEIQCRTLFSTHYHSLIDHFVGRKDIQLGHMACMVENEGDVLTERVTFLYKIIEGRCPKSYGFNVARLSGLKNAIILRAVQLSKELEDECNYRNIFTKLLSANMSVDNVWQLLRDVKIE